MERFTLKRGVMPSLARWAAFRSTAFSTQNVSEPMIPVFSAMPTMVVGGIGPEVGWRQRSSASAATGRPSARLDLRLVVDLELVGADRALQVDVEAVVDLGLDAVLALEDVVALLAGAGDAARDVGGHQQLRRVGGVLGHGRDAHAGAKDRRAALVGDGPVERAQALHGGEHGLRGVGDARQHDADLLLAQRGEAVLRAQRRPQPLDDEGEGDGGRRPLEERLQPVHAAQLHDQHREAPLGRLRDRRLAVEEAQQLLARALARGRDVQAVVEGGGHGAHER